jgi:amidophosphoribosyltransferase
MCGIVGLYLKNDALQGQLGALFSPMLVEMTDRGPDSAGIAVYRGGDASQAKLTLHHPDADFDWEALGRAAEGELAASVRVQRVANHAIVRSDGSPRELRACIERDFPSVRVTSAGQTLEIFKDVGLPASVLERHAIGSVAGTHALGHTRMATESAVTTAGAHPFNTGDDLCLVHNGSLSNHHRLREWLARHAGLPFQTDNDSEVAAAYLTWRLREGDSLSQALEAALEDLDGFFTFAVGTREGFSVVRDPIACKHAIMAETDDWVAMATEYRALARLPGVDEAAVWEPEPARVYSWGNA